MKVNIKTVLCATVFILFIGYNVYSSQKKGVISEMALANIEALASGESGASNTGPREEKNVMAADIKWCVVPLTPNHVLTLIVINFFFYAFVLILSRIWTRQLKPYLNYSLMIVLVKNEK